MGAKKKGQKAAPPPVKPSPVIIPLETIPPAKNPVVHVLDDPDGDKPDFIYDGPFILLNKLDHLIDAAQPFNVPSQGTFKKGPGYKFLKDDMPVLITKTIDNISRFGSDKSGIAALNKLKSDLMTNKRYEKFKDTTPEAEYWNNWIDSLKNPFYYSNDLVSTECYIYKKIAEACNGSDPYKSMKDTMASDSVEAMCVVATMVKEMIGRPPIPIPDETDLKPGQPNPADEAKKQQLDQYTDDLIILIKLCHWANTLDLQKSLCESVKLDEQDGLNPTQMLINLKAKLLVDNSKKAAKQMIKKAQAMRVKVDNPKPAALKIKCSCTRLAKKAKKFICEPSPSSSATALPAPAKPAKDASPTDGTSSPPPPPPKVVPCPYKMKQPTCVMIDIVTDNAGFELFMDMCFAAYLVKNDIVQKVRFHMKKYPAFISDATPDDIKSLASFCSSANHSREAVLLPLPESKKEKKARLAATAAALEAGTEPPPEPHETPVSVSSAALKELGQSFQKYLSDETFLILTEEFWTYPNSFKDMKKVDPSLYRSLQFATSIFMKGDMNYRKLVGGVRTPTAAQLNAAVGNEFKPAPILASHIMQSGIICSVKAGKSKKLLKKDPTWQESGLYGAIYWRANKENLKQIQEPCPDYYDTCCGTGCPVHKELGITM